MARDRKISPDFWTREAVIDCAPMTRLLFLGLRNFADDGGVQPLRPCTIRMRVFPGDPIDDDQVRAMIDELAAQGLVRIYEVEGQELRLGSELGPASASERACPTPLSGVSFSPRKR